MFYVSSTTGLLTPFEPEITPISISVKPLPAVSNVKITGPAVENALPAITTPAEFESSLLQASTPNAGSRQTSEAAIYEGHASVTARDFSSVTDSANLSRAGAIVAYQIQRGELEGEAPNQNTLSSINPIDDHQAENPHSEDANRVNPIKSYKRPVKERHTAVVAADVMSSPVFTLEEDTPLSSVPGIFKKHRFRHIPILGAANRLVGIISDRDLIALLPGEKEKKIREQMATNILTARPETEIRSVAEVMISHHIGCIPILAENGALLGIVTRGDILRAIVNHAPIELWT